MYSQHKTPLNARGHQADVSRSWPMHSCDSPIVCLLRREGASAQTHIMTEKTLNGTDYSNVLLCIQSKSAGEDTELHELKTIFILMMHKNQIL